MDAEIKQNFIKLITIKQKLFSAFADVRLGDGIGFLEADAIDDYLSPTDEKYIIARENDERLDCKKVYNQAKKTNLDSWYGPYYMDAKGLHFFLPNLLLIGGRDVTDNVLLGLISAEKPEYIELMNLLTLEHKKGIIEYLEYAVDYDDWVKFYIDHKGDECHKCGKIHKPESYTLEQAITKVESGEEYILLQKVKKHFNL